jgi:hypothetical protein
MLLDQQPEKAVGLYAHLVAKYLRKMDTHASELSDHQVFFAIWAACKILNGEDPDRTPLDFFPRFPKDDEE